MKVKILAQLATKFPGVQKTLLDRVADELAKTITKDEEIETAVTNSAGLINTFAAFAQSESDRRVTEAVKKREDELNAEINRLKAANPEHPNPGNPAAETPEQKQLKEIAAQLALMQAEKTGIALQQKVKDQLKAKGIPEPVINMQLDGRSFSKDEEIEAFVNNTETAYNATIQELTNQGLGVGQNPRMSNQGAAKAVEDDIKAWADSQQPKKV